MAIISRKMTRVYFGKISVYLLKEFYAFDIGPTFFCHLIFSPVVHLIFSFSRLSLCKTFLKNNCSWPVAISKLFLKPAMWGFFSCYWYAFFI